MGIKKIIKLILTIFLVALTIIPLTSCDNVNNILDLFCLHEFKGRIRENGNEPGISKVSGFLNEQKTSFSDQLILNTGDMFQSTYDSGMNKGNLLAEALPEMNCEAMAVGNHEFDWGIDAYLKNKKLAGKTTFLGANIYHYDKENKRVLDFASELCEPYKIVKRCGKNIGIIGIIGVNQIAAINSNIVDDLIFIDPLDVVLSLAEKLKGEKQCSAVVLLSHASFSELGMSFCDAITKESSKTKKRFVDVVFTGQTAKPEANVVNDVPFIQSDSRGREVSKISLNLEGDVPIVRGFTRKVIVPNETQQSIMINRIISRYITNEFIDKKEYEIGRIAGIREMTRLDVGKVLALVTYAALPDIHKDVDVIINNGGGKSIYPLTGGGITSGLIFDALPYTNKTYVAYVKGKEIKKLLNEKKYFAYYAPRKIALDDEKMYKIASIDYVLFHKNKERLYDNFPSFNGEYLYEIDKYSYELLIDYIYNHPFINYTTEIYKCPCFDNITNVR